MAHYLGSLIGLSSTYQDGNHAWHGKPSQLPRANKVMGLVGEP